LIWCDRGGNRLRSLRYVRYATIATLRYATLQTEEDRRKNDEGLLLVSDREGKRREKEGEDKRDTPEKRRLYTKDRKVQSRKAKSRKGKKKKKQTWKQ